MNAGAVELLAKPFRAQDLLDAIQEEIERDREALKLSQEQAGMCAARLAHAARARSHGLGRQGMFDKQIAATLHGRHHRA
ncbi:MAG: hypothetical protein ABSF38_16110 [Verrucomicrobiota bacterium]|jgi:FixJ family two-component response regulator